MFVIHHKKIFFSLSAVLVVASLIAIMSFGLPFGIDFTGGSITQVRYEESRPSVEELQARFDASTLEEYSLQPTGDTGYILRTSALTESDQALVRDVFSLSGTAQVTIERSNSIGPSIGKELRSKAFVAIGIVAVAIILFVAFAFRKVSKPVSSWKYGIIAIIALLHDIIIPTGLFALLGHFGQARIDALFVTALLAILGFSVNDTIVVFDRVRENLRRNRENNTHETFSETVGKSLAQTYTRSINTSLTTLVVLLALFLLGGDITRNFTLTLIVGVIAGTYSSIFLASPLLTVFSRTKSK